MDERKQQKIGMKKLNRVASLIPWICNCHISTQNENKRLTAKTEGEKRD